MMTKMYYKFVIFSAVPIVARFAMLSLHLRGAATTRILCSPCRRAGVVLLPSLPVFGLLFPHASTPPRSFPDVDSIFFILHSAKIRHCTIII